MLAPILALTRNHPGECGAAEKLDAVPIKEILVTDSVDTKEKTPKNIQYITASELIADAIVRIQERKPVSPLFAYNKK